MTTQNLQEQIQSAIDSLPVLNREEVASLADDACPICLVPFLALSGAKKEPLESVITKVSGCGHVFCKNDLTEWIRGRHGSCPSCRHGFLDIKPPSESDDESSDGGEYLPPSDDFEDEDDGFLDTDGFTDADAEDFGEEDMEAFHDAWDDDDDDALIEDPTVEDVDLFFDEDFEVDQDGPEECSLTEGCSETMSDPPSQVGLPVSESVKRGHEGVLHDTSESKQ